MPKAFRLFMWVAVTVILIGTPVRSQDVPLPPPPPSSPAAPVQVPTPIPLAEVVAQAESISENLRAIEAELGSNQLLTTVSKELPVITREIDAHREESASVLASRPSLETVRTVETGWQKLGERLSVWEHDLTAYAVQLNTEGERLVTVSKTWEQTLELAQQSETPQEIIQRIKTVLSAIKQTQGDIEAQKGQILTLQSRVSKQEARVSEGLATITQARDQAVTHLLVKDNPPLWSAEMPIHMGPDLIEDSQISLATQFATLQGYLKQQKGRIMLHVILCLLLIALLYWTRRYMQPWVDEEPSLRRLILIFNRPVATALVLTFLISGWIYPAAPRLWWALLGAAVLLPTMTILRQPLESSLFPILNALVLFYLLDQIRVVTSSLPVLSRVLLLGELCGGLLFAARLSSSARLTTVSETERTTREKTIHKAARFAAVIFAIAIVANVLGYVSLAQLLGETVLGSFYLAVILYAVMRMVDGAIAFGLRVRPLASLGIVRRHRSLLQHRLHRVVQAVTISLWALYTLDLLSLRGPVIEKTSDVLTATLVLGSLQLSLGRVLVFGLTVWGALLLSRFLRFFLEEDVYPRFQLARGVPYVISTILHYVVLVIGAVLAVAAVGVDMTKFTILAGAVGVGLGFGLQNIVNNFVSGLIVLFERPIKVGDVIQIDDATGVVARIGIRATMIRTTNGADVIVPNGKLISDRVTNWTFSKFHRGIELPVSVASGTDPHRVIELLKGVASAHPLVIDDPPPRALLIKFSATTLDFELRAWTSRFEEWGQIRSDLAIAIHAALGEEHIAVT